MAKLPPRWPSCPQDGHPLAILGRRPLSARRKHLGRPCRVFLPKMAKTATPSPPTRGVTPAASAGRKCELSSRIWTTDYWLLTIGCGVCTFCPPLSGQGCLPNAWQPMAFFEKLAQFFRKRSESYLRLHRFMHCSVRKQLHAVGRGRGRPAPSAVSSQGQVANMLLANGYLLRALHAGEEFIRASRSPNWRLSFLPRSNAS